MVIYISLFLAKVAPTQSAAPPSAFTANPFSDQRPVFPNAALPRPTMNQIKQQPFGNVTPVVQDPWTPVNTNTTGATANTAPWLKPLDQPNPFFS